jgi:hypothetical protein
MLELFCSDHPLSLGEQRRVNRRKVRALQCFVQLVNEFSAELLGPLGRNIRIIHQQLHTQRVQPLGHFLSDPPQPDNRECLPGHLGTEELAFRPLSVGEPGV